jgi:hypothetical protein
VSAPFEPGITSTVREKFIPNPKVKLLEKGIEVMRKPLSLLSLSPLVPRGERECFLGCGNPGWRTPFKCRMQNVEWPENGAVNLSMGDAGISRKVIYAQEADVLTLG